MPASPFKEPEWTTARALQFCAIILGVALLYFAREFLLPVVLAALISLTLKPIVRWLHEQSIPSAVSATTLMVLVAIALAVAAYTLTGPITRIVDHSPTLGATVAMKLRSVMAPVKALAEASKDLEQVTKPDQDARTQEVVVRQSSLMEFAGTNVWYALSTFGVTIFLALFLLASGDDLYRKIIELVPALEDKKTTLRILLDTETAISSYLFTIAIVNIGLGIIITAIMWVAGMPSPLLIGFAATCLNFLPYIGALFGIGTTAVVSLLTFNDIWQILTPPFAYLCVTSFEGSIFTPLLLGRKLNLNPVAIVMAVAFWGWLWGLIGILIAVPVLLTIKIACERIPSGKRLGVFLSSTKGPIP